MREKIPDSNISECNNLQVDIFLLKVEHCERKLGAKFFHKQRFFTFIYLFIYLFIYGCVPSSLLCMDFLQLRQARGYSSLRCAGFSLSWFLLSQSTASRRAGFSSCGTWAQQLWLLGSRMQAQQLWRTGLVALRHVGIFLDQGSNLCPLHWQADS